MPYRLPRAPRGWDLGTNLPAGKRSDNPLTTTASTYFGGATIACGRLPHGWQVCHGYAVVDIDAYQLELLSSRQCLSPAPSSPLLIRMSGQSVPEEAGHGCSPLHRQGHTIRA